MQAGNSLFLPETNSGVPDFAFSPPDRSMPCASPRRCLRCGTNARPAALATSSMACISHTLHGQEFNKCGPPDVSVPASAEEEETCTSVCVHAADAPHL